MKRLTVLRLFYKYKLPNDLILDIMQNHLLYYFLCVRRNNLELLRDDNVVVRDVDKNNNIVLFRYLQDDKRWTPIFFNLQKIENNKFNIYLTNEYQTLYRRDINEPLFGAKYENYTFNNLPIYQINILKEYKNKIKSYIINNNNDIVLTLYLRNNSKYYRKKSMLFDCSVVDNINKIIYFYFSIDLLSKNII